MPTVFDSPIASTLTDAPVPLGTTLCASDRPLMLLPVRLETRFFRQQDRSYELRIRIYPDKIHIDSHESELTPQEAEWGRHYWEQAWHEGTQANAQGPAWNQLADRFGAARAAWIARALQPLNPQDRPASPVPVTQALPVAINHSPAVMASGDGQNDSWRRAPLARLLPDRWIAMAYSAAALVVTSEGVDIKPSLTVGPDPKFVLPDTVGDDQLPIDPGMLWMVDFEAAEAAGMGLRMPVSPGLAARGIDTLLVMGVGASIAPDDAAGRLALLFDAHHYTDGLSFLRTGVPTNNTEEARSGYNPADSGDRGSGAATGGTGGGNASAAADPGSNARQFGAALGLATDSIAPVLSSLALADGRHDLDHQSMNAALWPVTWGYFLTNMIGFDGSGLTPELIEWARAHFIANVRSVGPYPALRCARQPYGVLPVTSMDFWQPASSDGQSSEEAWLHSFLLRLRDSVWRAHAGSVAKVGQTSEPGADLGEVMRLGPQSISFTTRSLLGNHYLHQLRAFMLEDLELRGWSAAHEAITSSMLQTLGIAWRPRLSRATFDDRPWRVAAPLVQASGSSADRRLEPDYIAALLAEPGIASIRDGHVQTGETASLLHALLRHALLLEYAQVAASILSAQGATFNGRDISYATLIGNQELVNLLPGSQETMTWKWQLDQVVPAVTGAQSLAAWLGALTEFQAPKLASLGMIRASLAHLRTLDSEALQFLMQGTLDLATHRLDAWIISLATRRLNAMRANAPLGIVVGGYGWVENLKPAAPLDVISAPADEPGPIYAQPGDTGFVHAPSLAHATTAALLRNAHLGHDGAALADGPFAIDLSSSRMRDARKLLDGVRQGQPLGALLGYRFERRLHELSQDQFIDDFRAIAPLAADRLGPPGEPQESVAANNVVDGLLLHQRWPAQISKLQALVGAAYPAIERELTALGESIDSVSDALMAETAYQLVRGNLPRTASTLKSVSQGDAPPPELEVAMTPRTGAALTHRVVLLLDAEAGWSSGAASPRRQAEPALDAWVAGVLGDSANVRCVVDELDASGETAAVHEVRLDSLQLCALDVLFAVDSESPTGTLSELERRVLYAVRRSVPQLTDAASLRVSVTRPAGFGLADRTLADIVELARQTRRLLARVRPLDAHDLDLPERETVVGVDLAELTARTLRAEAALGVLRTQIDGLMQAPADATSDQWRSAITQAGLFGVAGSTPSNAVGDGATQRSALLGQAKVLGKELVERMGRVEALPALPAGLTDAVRRDRLLDRMQVVFGPAFVVVPQFACANAGALMQAQTASEAVQGGDKLAVYTWFTRCERVRDPLYRLGSALRTAEILESGARLNLTVAQLPPGAGERWVALEAIPGKTVATGRLSLIIQSAAVVDAARPLKGLLVDEWVEVVPNATENTAVAFQFDPPDSSAPQTVLLAVPPISGKPWTAWDLQRVLLETLESARLRAVDSQLLGDLAHYLPATYFGFNDDAGAVVSTDFAPLTRP